MRVSKSSASLLRSSVAAIAGPAAVVALLAAIGISAAWWCFQHGYSLYYGDAEAHLNIARRILDSRTPGPEQIGTVWLPLPHVLLIPFVMRDAWWQLHCELVLERPPELVLEPAVAADPFYRFLERTWMAQQLPWQSFCSIGADCLS